MGLGLIKIFIALLRKNKIKSFSVSLQSLTGKHIEIKSGCFVDGYSEIGSYTFIGRNCSITKSKIGRYCSIANNVSIGQGEHSLDRISTSTLFYQNSYEELTKDICEIGNDVWIGTDAVILRGVRIGDGAVIGANAVVTTSVPDFAIVVGVPAKILRFRFSEKKRVQIKESFWWLHERLAASKILNKLYDEKGVTCL